MWVNEELNWGDLKLRELKWQNTNLEDWNEKWWNLEGEFCILAKEKNSSHPIIVVAATSL